MIIEFQVGRLNILYKAIIGITVASLSISANMPTCITWCIYRVNDLIVMDSIILEPHSCADGRLVRYHWGTILRCTFGGLCECAQPHQMTPEIFSFWGADDRRRSCTSPPSLLSTSPRQRSDMGGREIITN